MASRARWKNVIFRTGGGISVVILSNMLDQCVILCVTITCIFREWDGREPTSSIGAALLSSSRLSAAAAIVVQPYRSSHRTSFPKVRTVTSWRVRRIIGITETYFQRYTTAESFLLYPYSTVHLHVYICSCLDTVCLVCFLSER